MGEALSDLAAALARVGWFNEAGEVACGIEDYDGRLSALHELVASLAGWDDTVRRVKWRAALKITMVGCPH